MMHGSPALLLGPLMLAVTKDDYSQNLDDYFHVLHSGYTC